MMQIAVTSEESDGQVTQQRTSVGKKEVKKRAEQCREQRKRRKIIRWKKRKIEEKSSGGKRGKENSRMVQRPKNR